MKEKLHDYPALIDPFLDLEATREFIGTASCIYGIEHYQARSGETIVYMRKQIESEIPVYDRGKYIGRKFSHGIVVAGELVKPSGLLSFLKKDKIRVISQTSQDEVESELTILLSKKEKQPEFVEFWSEH